MWPSTFTLSEKKKLAGREVDSVLHRSRVRFARDAPVTFAHLDGSHYVEAGGVIRNVPAKIAGLAIEMDVVT